MFFLFTISLLCISISIVAIYISVRQFYRREAPPKTLVRLHKTGETVRVTGVAAPGFQYLGDPESDITPVTSAYEYQIVRGFPPKTRSGVSRVVYTLLTWCFDGIEKEDIEELLFTETARVPGYPSGTCVIATNTAFAGCPVLYWYPIMGFWLVCLGTIDWVQHVEWVDVLPSEQPPARYRIVLKNGHVVPIQDIV